MWGGPLPRSPYNRAGPSAVQDRRGRYKEMHRLRNGRLQSARVVLVAAVLSMSLAGCGSNSSEPAVAGETTATDAAPAATSGLAATERFMETWNTRDPEMWTRSLRFPHARPSPNGLRLWGTEDEYVATVDYANAIATGWDHTEFEDLQIVHDGDAKAHIAGRWARFDAAGGVIRRNLVTYVATEVEGDWGIRARFSAGGPLPESEAEQIADIAIAKVEEYLNAFNSREPVAWAATLNYPHLRIASGELRVSETEEEFANQMDFDVFAERFGWDHSEWDEIEAIQVAENGVNVALTFSRYNAAGDVVSTFNTLYLVTNDNGRWGVLARSSFAP